MSKLTHAEFHALLRRSAQPLETEQPDSAADETSESPSPESCTGKNIRRGLTE
jgi:hypothetical protein